MEPSILIEFYPLLWGPDQLDFVLPRDTRLRWCRIRCFGGHSEALSAALTTMKHPQMLPIN
jgi:hypothetical protein